MTRSDVEEIMKFHMNNEIVRRYKESGGSERDFITDLMPIAMNIYKETRRKMIKYQINE